MYMCVTVRYLCMSYVFTVTGCPVCMQEVCGVSSASDKETLVIGLALLAQY